MNHFSLAKLYSFYSTKKYTEPKFDKTGCAFEDLFYLKKISSSLDWPPYVFVCFFFLISNDSSVERL